MQNNEQNKTATTDTDFDTFFNVKKKNKILFLSDHPLATSGVGVQARVLIEGLLKTGKYSFKCLGGAMKHSDYRPMMVNEDFVVVPVDGFGTKDQIRNLLYTEKPDAIFIFTDPRQFIWLWEMEDEIHQVCPIAYWHVWDNDPYPAFNKPWYDGTDLISCLSWKTYGFVKEHYPETSCYIPHAFPKEFYFPIDKDKIEILAKQQFGEKADWFKMLWVNRNAHRKGPNDVLDSWKLFLDKLEKKYGHKKAVLIMHTDPKDFEGPDIITTAQTLGITNNVWYSVEKLQFEQMNALHNLADGVVNIAKAEGFGLSTLISMQVGKPIIALKTGGLTRQVVDWRDGSHNGVALDPVKRQLIGSQQVPYIYEDYASTDETAEAFLKLFEMTPEEKDAMRKKCIDYVDFEFDYNDMISKWDMALETLIENYKNTNKQEENKWSLSEIVTEGSRVDAPPVPMQQVIPFAGMVNPAFGAPTANNNNPTGFTVKKREVVL